MEINLKEITDPKDMEANQVYAAVWREHEYRIKTNILIQYRQLLF